MYKQNAEGDYKSTEDEVNAMIRDVSEEGNMDWSILDKQYIGYNIYEQAI